MNKKIIWGIVVVIIIIGGGLGYYYLSEPRFLCWPYCPGMTDQDREEIKKSALEAETANWKTYSDYGFSFKYPAEMGVPEVAQLSTSTEVSFKNSVSFNVGVRYNQNLGRNLSFNEVVNQEENNSSYSRCSKDNIILGGKDAVKLSCIEKITGGGSTVIFIPIDAKGNILRASDYGRGVGNVGGVGINAILSTFKFTK